MSTSVFQKQKPKTLIFSRLRVDNEGLKSSSHTKGCDLEWRSNGQLLAVHIQKIFLKMLKEQYPLLFQACTFIIKLPAYSLLVTQNNPFCLFYYLLLFFKGVKSYLAIYSLGESFTLFYSH